MKKKNKTKNCVLLSPHTQKKKFFFAPESESMEDTPFSRLRCHFDAELVLCSILDLDGGSASLDISGLVAGFLTSFNTERGRLVLLRGALFCGHLALLKEVMREILTRETTSSKFRAEACRFIISNGFDDHRHSAAATKEGIAAVQHECLKTLAEGSQPLLSSFKLMCGFVSIAPSAIWIASFFDAACNTGRLTLAFASHRCFGFLPVLTQLRHGLVVEELPDCDDVEWSVVFRGVGVHENVTLLESLFVKYLKLAEREHCGDARAAIMLAAATLWQRIGRIRITKAISHYAFDTVPCRAKYVTPCQYKYGSVDDRGGPAVSPCPLEAFEAALLAYNLTRNLVVPELAAAALNCTRRIQALAAASAPENIFAHFTGAANVPFGVQLTSFLAKAGNQVLLAYLFLKTAFLCDSATVTALKATYSDMPDGQPPKLLLFQYMKPVLQTTESISLALASAASKKQKV